MDQLNTPAPASFDEVFPPEKAERPADQPEIHRTPKHGSPPASSDAGRARWLDFAEVRFSVWARDLPERVADRSTLERHVTAWRQRRNAVQLKATGRITIDETRIRLRKLDPTPDS